MTHSQGLDPINRRHFGQLGISAAAWALIWGRGAAAAPTDLDPPPGPMEFAGVYFHDGFDAESKRLAPLYWDAREWRKQIDWLSFCGIDAVEFATQMEFSRVPQTKLERRKVADRLRVMDAAHAAGLQFAYILGNTTVSTVPDGEEPGGQQGGRAENLCPRVAGNFERTLAIQHWYMETFREADFFEEFAADWGGCGCGACGVPDYLRYVESLANHLWSLNKSASLYANTWAIAWWGPEPLAQGGWKRVWDMELTGSREVIAALPRLPNNTHLALSCSHLYRPLAHGSYGSRGATPQFPTAEDLRTLTEAGRSVLAWPHFVMDDDISRAPAWGIVHSETRYLASLMRTLSKAGIRRVMGNLYLPTLQLSNTFSLGQLKRNPAIATHEILSEFATLVARPEDAAALTDVLVWLDNNSYWDEQIRQFNTPDALLPPTPTDMTRESATKAVAAVRPASSPKGPLPVPPEVWLDDLRHSIERMVWAA